MHHELQAYVDDMPVCWEQEIYDESVFGILARMDDEEALRVDAQVRLFFQLVALWGVSLLLFF